MTRVEECIDSYKRWCAKLGITKISDVNRAVSEGRSSELVNLGEIRHEQSISQIAQRIFENPQKRLILISGPSSSGKTTFASRLKLHLKVLGIEAVTISLDNYFIKTEDMPLGDDGKADFESFESIDYRLFNEHIMELICGGEVSMPRFDFERAVPVPDAQKLRLKNDEIIIIEGIHALNEKLAENVPEQNRYRIYCTALTCLETDGGDTISSTATRLIRRTIRDFYFRNTSASYTFDLWANVEKGAKKNIYPYTDSADIVFNSSLLYEFGVYEKHLKKVFANVNLSPGYEKIRQSMFDLTKNFVPIDESIVPPMSIVKEFTGGSTLF